VFRYPEELLAALGAFGLAPRATTPPAVVRDALNDLYRFELRRMRDRLRAGHIAAADYYGLVVALRKHYGIKIETVTAEVKAHFANVRSLARFVQSQAGAAA